ncbi:arginine/serine-rich protein PNISR [Contarinia nasturtii]|uniref:arginine/serine-rich protein PNISR n=1 Tax=Contarinia nasturtii TaxID=265458 RepID=UPI0012D3D458|nr:arginine/serine-rich protein PNISR [Contarinia nasturtii]
MYPHKGAFPPMGAAAPNLAPTNIPIGDGNQWMSQSAYQNIDLDKVDWAVLAQQWIHMKESCTIGGTNEPSMPCAPPPPRFTNTISSNSNDYEEQGEAAMEIDHEDEQTPNDSIINVTAPPPPTNIFHQTSPPNNWNSESNSNSRGHQKNWNRKGNRWGSSKSQRIPPGGDGYAASGQVFNNAKQMGSVWSTPPASASSSTNMPPFMHINAHANEQFKMHGMDANSKSGIQLEQIGLNATPTLDAAQRKTLPAWIRDGLEKMEREKLKQAERDREMKERDEKRRQEKIIEQNLLMQLNANESSPKLPAKSKFESDSESDYDETVNSDYSENMTRKAKMVTGGGGGDERTTVVSSANATSSDSTTVPTTFKPHLTKAEILTEIMLSVRKNLTEILLEVTNEEIYAIAQDTLSKVRTKGRKAQSVQKNALTAITPALGLVVYDDSDASRSGDESDSDGANEQNASENDSDNEIKRVIQRRKAAFETKSEEIESYLAEIEEREKQWLDRDDSVEEQKSSNNQLSVPSAINPPKSNEIPDIPREPQKMPNASKSERKNSRFSDVKSLVYNVANSQMASAASSLIRPDSRSSATDSKKHEIDKRDVNSDDSDSSQKRSKHSSSTSFKSSHHRSKRDRSHSPSSSRRHKKSSRRRSSSSSSERSSYSHHSGRSRKHSRRDRSSSDDRTSKSSQGSHKRDKYSREKSYSRSSHSYKRSRH